MHQIQTPSWSKAFCRNLLFFLRFSIAEAKAPKHLCKTSKYIRPVKQQQTLRSEFTLYKYCHRPDSQTHHRNNIKKNIVQIFFFSGTKGIYKKWLQNLPKQQFFF